MNRNPGIRLAVIAIVLFTISCGGHRAQQPTGPESDPHLKELVDSSSLPTVVTVSGTPRPEASALVRQVRRFYERTGYRLIWVDRGHPSRRFTQLAQILRSAPHHGLNPQNYDVSAAPGMPARASTGADAAIPPDRAADFDLWATFALFRYATHLTAGQLDPHTFEQAWTLTPKRPDLVEALAQAVEDNNLPDAMERLAPKHPEYVALQRVLDRYHVIEAKGGWPVVPQVRRLKERDSSPAVPTLRRRLAISGDLDDSLEMDPSTAFDAALSDAVRRFQDRHRFKPDGIVTPAVVAAMNVPVEARIRQIELNLERWRWLPDQMPDRYLRVNVPDYKLEAIEQRRAVMDIRVIVGERALPTPIFADQMTYVVFSPYWNIPSSIVRREMMPHAEAEPDYFERHDIDVVPGPDGNVSYRQRPGPRNALGLVKFVFPNNFNVYLHDTPTDHLFQKIDRDLSHGCVRVEEPVKLAQYVLRDQPEWTEENIEEAMNAGHERTVTLKTPIPVFILYLTAWADEHGTAKFLEDVYGHDAEQMAHLPR